MVTDIHFISNFLNINYSSFSFLRLDSLTLDWKTMVKEFWILLCFEFYFNENNFMLRSWWEEKESRIMNMERRIICFCLKVNQASQAWRTNHVCNDTFIRLYVVCCGISKKPVSRLASLVIFGSQEDSLSTSTIFASSSFNDNLDFNDI